MEKIEEGTPVYWFCMVDSVLRIGTVIEIYEEVYEYKANSQEVRTGTPESPGLLIECEGRHFSKNFKDITILPQ
jgi:hypothetical protein